MTKTAPRSEMIGRRAELLAELFLEDLDPEFVAQPAANFAYDFYVGFRNAKGGLNNIAVEVKATERLTGDHYPVSRDQYERWAHSNIPVLLLVIDVKQNRLSYALASLEAAGSPATSDTVMLQLTEVDEAAREQLRRQLAA